MMNKEIEVSEERHGARVKIHVEAWQGTDRHALALLDKLVAEVKDALHADRHTT